MTLEPKRCDELSGPALSEHGVVVKKAGLELRFEGHSKADFLSWRWLRDHGTDEESLDAVTLQRKVDTFNLPDDLQARQVQVNTDSQELVFEWSDGAMSRLAIERVSSALGLTQGPEALSRRTRVLWDGLDPLDDLPTVDYEAVLHTEHGLQEWVQLIYRFGFCLVANVPSTDTATEALAGRLGPPLTTLFGTFWHLSADLKDHGDTAYTTEYLDPHTDGTYYHDAPGLQLFNCQQFDGKGGESVQVDGFALARRLKEMDPAAYETLTRIEVPGHYIEPGQHVRASRPVFKLDVRGDLEQVSFNNYDRAPFVLSPREESAFYHAYSLFHRLACDQSHWLKIPLRPGTALIFDNWRNLHGRMGYVGKRLLYGCYHSRATFESSARVLRQSAEGGFL